MSKEQQEALLNTKKELKSPFFEPKCIKTLVRSDMEPHQRLFFDQNKSFWLKQRK